METNPIHDLDDIRRLQADTRTEARKTPRGAFAVLAVAILVLFSAFTLENDSVQIALVVTWWVFIGLWLRWVNRGSRVRVAGASSLTPTERRSALAAWVGYAVVANVIVFAGSKISWVLVGVLLAALSTGSYWFAAVRNRRAA